MCQMARVKQEPRTIRRWQDQGTKNLEQFDTNSEDCFSPKLRGWGVFYSNAYRARNEWAFAKTVRCLSALGIVAKEQELARCRLSQNRPDFRITYCHHILYCSFGTSSYARVCAGFAGDYWRLPCSKLQGIFPVRNFNRSVIRPLTPQQAAGNALAIAGHGAVQIEKTPRRII